MSHQGGHLYFSPPPGQLGVPPPLPPRNGAVAVGPNPNHQDGSHDVARPPPLPPRVGLPAYQATLPQQALWPLYAAPPVSAAQPASQPYPYPEQYPSAVSGRPAYLTQQNQVPWTYTQTSVQVPLRAPETSADSHTAAGRNHLREQQPWYQDMLRRQDEELQSPEVQKILQQRQADLAEHLERQRQEEQSHYYARPQSHVTDVVADQGPQPAYQYQYGNPTAPAQTYVTQAYNDTARYSTLQQSPPFRSDMPQYGVAAWANPGANITGQVALTEQAKKTFGAKKWVNKLNDLSNGLSELQLQLSAAAAANSSTTTAAPSAPADSGPDHVYLATTAPTTAYLLADTETVHLALPVVQSPIQVVSDSLIQDGAAVPVQRDFAHTQGPDLGSQTSCPP
ncbi:hypothetical protein MN608_09097 [Microdochium nivale]|nr:hypothetical protein MN608_09097 [Microdochium nivale]